MKIAEWRRIYFGWKLPNSYMVQISLTKKRPWRRIDEELRCHIGNDWRLTVNGLTVNGDQRWLTVTNGYKRWPTETGQLWSEKGLITTSEICEKKCSLTIQNGGLASRKISTFRSPKYDTQERLGKLKLGYVMYEFIMHKNSLTNSSRDTLKWSKIDQKRPKSCTRTCAWRWFRKKEVN